METLKVIVYRTEAGVDAFDEYVDSLKDRSAASRIRVRITRAKLGNLGDHKSIGYGIIELRIDYGPGYRVYVGLQGSELIVLLCAGDKSTQAKDIKKAISYWADYERNL